MVARTSGLFTTHFDDICVTAGTILFDSTPLRLVAQATLSTTLVTVSCCWQDAVSTRDNPLELVRHRQPCEFFCSSPQRLGLNERLTLACVATSLSVQTRSCRAHTALFAKKSVKCHVAERTRLCYHISRCKSRTMPVIALTRRRAIQTSKAARLCTVSHQTLRRPSLTAWHGKSAQQHACARQKRQSRRKPLRSKRLGFCSHTFAVRARASLFAQSPAVGGIRVGAPAARNTARLCCRAAKPVIRRPERYFSCAVWCCTAHLTRRAGWGRRRMGSGRGEKASWTVMVVRV